MVERLSGNPFATFIPWIIFWVVAGSRSTWEYGALGALLASLILLGPDLRQRKVKMLDGATVIFFAAMAIAGIIASPSDGEWLDRWANTLSSGALGVLVLVTLPVMPFTEQYAREMTPPEVWNTAGFRRTNQVITLVWGLVFVATAILGAIAASSPSTSDWTNWILPIALIVGAFKFTERYPEVVRARYDAVGARSRSAAPGPRTTAGAR
jgi:uncharacterized membrane protein